MEKTESERLLAESIERLRAEITKNKVNILIPIIISAARQRIFHIQQLKISKAEKILAILATVQETAKTITITQTFLPKIE